MQVLTAICDGCGGACAPKAHLLSCRASRLRGSVRAYKRQVAKRRYKRTGAMLALFRDIASQEPCGIHRTFLDSDGRKLDRKMLGRGKSAAIKIDANENVTHGLHIGEGVETCLAAHLAGFRPV